MQFRENNLLYDWFHEFCQTQTDRVEKWEIFSHQIFLKINSLITFFTKLLLPQSVCQKCVRANFHSFHTVQNIRINSCCSCLWKNSVKVIYSKKQVEKLISRNFCQRGWEYNSIPQCENFSIFLQLKFYVKLILVPPLSRNSKNCHYAYGTFWTSRTKKIFFTSNMTDWQKNTEISTLWSP